MDSLVGYGSDDEIETERYGPQQSVSGGTSRRREDDTNYDSVNMDMSEESQDGESEPELPQVERSRPPAREHRGRSDESRESDRERDRARSRDPEREHGREQQRAHERARERERPHERSRERERDSRRDDRRSPRRDDRSNRPERAERRSHDAHRRGLLGDRPDEKPLERSDNKHGADAGWTRSQDARDAASPRFVDRDRTDRRDRDRERARERDGRSRRSEEKRSGRDRRDDRSRSRGAAYPPPQSCNDRRSPNGDYRPSSYKVNKKLEVMEKMGLQIKTPDGSMATAQQLRAAACDAPRLGPALGVPGARVLQQVQKRKLLWANKNKAETEVAKWSGTKFAQDSDGKQVSKFMRLMGIKDPAAIATETPETSADPNKKQEELFEAMQAQYDVARATTHTMRGVGLGFQRSQF